ncbi:competence protein CoiA family protein [Bacillus sp. B15-48]|uniref:DUF3895 domain-containing protein n=1 Tax=Bacillus sp. B15-48 TaxID=1548601 RepID=UPI00193F5CEB|nr:competence protein CoiA family protein [Bacillus sp. B15-48]MBM4761440.1 DUF3895 domain-containing protein [Bacillus sp. B15-48]
MQEALYEGKYFDLKIHMESIADVKGEINKLKKRADKGAFQCPYCLESLILKSGEIREEHFAHRHSKSCEVSVASEVYQKQVKRESKKHSVMKEIIYDELKTQEKINDRLKVDYGYIKKASEKWSYYPDIVIDSEGRELAIIILTDVTSNKDESLVKQIKKRNSYFKKKSLEPIWFIEDVEQSVDMDHRVIHLWEAEYDIAIKTTEDVVWEKMINSMPLSDSIFDLFTYYHTKSPSFYDVQSVYYVHSTETSIEFTVQRFIKDRDKHPYRAFALNDAYRISLSTALWTNQELQLCDPNIEKNQRERFVLEAKKREVEYRVNEQEKQQRIELATKSDNEKALIQKHILIPKWRENQSILNQKERPTLQKSEFAQKIKAYIRDTHEFSATEVSNYLVLQCGASPETYRTGRYKIYPDVCQCLEELVDNGVLELVYKEFVNDRVYKVLNISY